MQTVLNTEICLTRPMQTGLNTEICVSTISHFVECGSSMFWIFLKQLCNNNDEAFERLLLHTEVRWLSKGTSLARFYSLFDTVLEFLQSCDPDFAQGVMLVRNDTAYLSDIFAKFNALNLALQGNEVNLFKVKSAMSGLKNKLVVQFFSRCFRDPIRVPRIENRVPRIRENYHRVHRIRENWVPGIRNIGSLPGT